MKYPDEYVVIDIETTGLSYFDKIIEIAAVKVRNGEIIDTFAQLINPCIPISKRITSLTGITNEMVADQPPIEQVMPQFVQFVGTLPSVGCNVHFDISRIRHACEGLGIEPPPLVRCGDVRYMSQESHPEWQQHNLAFLREQYGINDENAHRALADVIATKLVYEQLCNEAAEDHCIPAMVPPRMSPNPRRIAWVRTEEKSLDGLNICVTGDIPAITRTGIKALIKSHGGTFKSTMSRYVNILVRCDEYAPATTKVMDAYRLIEKGHDIKIIGYKDLMRMMGYGAQELYDRGCVVRFYDLLSRSECMDIFFPRYPSDWQEIFDELIFDPNNDGYQPGEFEYHSLANGNLSFSCYGEKEFEFRPGLLGDSRLVIPADIARKMFPDEYQGEDDADDKPKTVLYLTSDQLKQFAAIIRARKDAQFRSLGEPFACCNSYEECSDARECLHKDDPFYNGCHYRRNLEQGRVFFGKNSQR